MNDSTKNLLAALRRVHWPDGVLGPVSEAIQQWREDGCPDAPSDERADWMQTSMCAVDFFNIMGISALMCGGPSTARELFDDALMAASSDLVHTAGPTHLLDCLLQHTARAVAVEAFVVGAGPVRDNIPRAAHSTLDSYVRTFAALIDPGEAQ